MDSSISARRPADTPWFTTWKKPTVSAAAFNWESTSDRRAERSMTGMVAEEEEVGWGSGEWWKIGGTVLTPASTRPFTPALVSSNACRAWRRSVVLVAAMLTSGSQAL
jgi:hypothetical protein